MSAQSARRQRGGEQALDGLIRWRDSIKIGSEVEVLYGQPIEYGAEDREMHKVGRGQIRAKDGKGRKRGALSQQQEQYIVTYMQSFAKLIWKKKERKKGKSHVSPPLLPPSLVL